MKTLLTFVIGIALILSGCQETGQDNDTLPSNERKVLLKCISNYVEFQLEEAVTQAEYKSNGKAKTIKFHSSEGTMGVIPNPDACGDFSPPLQFIIDGGGNASHIGLFSVENLACVDTEGNFLSPIYGFIIAANGDEIHTMVVGATPDPDNPPHITYNYIILGGTGRFLDATGYIDMYGITDMETGTWSLTGIGEITY